MPELPEVETTRRGITNHITGKRLTHVTVTQPKLRYPVPIEALCLLVGTPLITITRRAKYLLLGFEQSTLITHLGMSGSLRITTADSEWRKHDHWQLLFDDVALRYHDPRRFGFMIMSQQPAQHPLLRKLGVEPLETTFTASYLKEQLKQRKSAIKVCLMDNHIVVGIGNIYACESLFLAGIHPEQPANCISDDKITQLHAVIIHILKKAISQGGSTLRDFVNPDGNPGYFAQTLSVYGRTGLACPNCQTPVESIKQAGRTTFFCPHCQTKS
jgi:formamidopyrimidine-DNA glycosylase